MAKKAKLKEGSVLTSAGEAARGERSQQQLTTATNHFNKFLREHLDGGESKTLDTLKPHEVTAELIGCFGTYLFMNLKKISGAQSYLSQIQDIFHGKVAISNKLVPPPKHL